MTWTEAKAYCENLGGHLITINDSTENEYFVKSKMERESIEPFTVELNEEYVLLTQKRLELAEDDKTIQGYSDGVFWERNSAVCRKST